MAEMRSFRGVSVHYERIAISCGFWDTVVWPPATEGPLPEHPDHRIFSELWLVAQRC